MNVLKKLLIVVAMSALSVSAIASDAARAEAKQVIELKNGSTIYIFKNGKMSMEDKYGHAKRMKQGTVMEGKDGKKYMMYGDEVQQLNSLLEQGHGGS